ncbi:MAG: 16S rRNA (guanine(527)-N(7))-methyltransferase RsmG [Deltaproteobacteria bacterium]|nr:16S rRNA (guanine(527)-N(7))-methyltransferase RsmG [Deltaproteobacteria bacterium]
MQLARYLDELQQWNRRMNLTALRGDAEIALFHFADSLTLAPQLAPTEPLLDIGTGAGFPGLPVKLALPGLPLTLLEATAKKVSFLRHLVRVLGLRGVTVLDGRAEALGAVPGLQAAFGAVTARALGDLPKTVRLGAPFLRPGGRLLAMRGSQGPVEVREAAVAVGQAGLIAEAVIPYRLPGLRAPRHLVVLRRPRVFHVEQ